MNFKNFNLNNFLNTGNDIFRKYYKYIIIFLLLISFIRPVLANLDYSLLTSWDTWNFLSFSKLVYDNGGIPPNWDNLSLYPEGRPFLYPPLVPTILANISLLIGVSIFYLIKISTVFLYPLFVLFSFLLTLPFKNKKLSALTLIFLLSVNQAYVNSLNSLSQFTEIFFLIFVVLLIYKKKYNWAILPFGLMFWTHSFTPFFFGAGLMLYAFFQKEERWAVLKTIIFGFILGSPWLYRFFIFRDWIHPNVFMPEHLASLKSFYWRFFIEGWSFSAILLIAVLGVMLNRKIMQKIKENRFFVLLLTVSSATLPIYYYPERAITYTAPFFLPIAAFIFLNLSFDKLRKSFLIILPLLFLVALYSLSPAGWLLDYHSSFVYIIFVLMLVFVGVYFKAHKKIILYLFLILILYFHPEAKGMILPFSSWLNGGPIRMNAAPEIYDACKWLKEYDPEAVFATDSVHLIGACQYFGIKSSEGPVLEFSKDGGLWHHSSANYFISVTGSVIDDSNNDFEYLWHKGTVAIFRLRSTDSLELRFEAKNPANYSRAWFGLVDDIFKFNSNSLGSSAYWVPENSCFFLIDENSFKDKKYSLSFSMDQKKLILVDKKGKKYSCELNFSSESSTLYSKGDRSLKFQLSFQDSKNFSKENKYLYEFNFFLTENNKFIFTDTPTSRFVPWAGKAAEQKIAPVFKMEGEYFARPNP